MAQDGNQYRGQFPQQGPRRQNGRQQRNGQEYQNGRYAQQQPGPNPTVQAVLGFLKLVVNTFISGVAEHHRHQEALGAACRCGCNG